MTTSLSPSLLRLSSGIAAGCIAATLALATPNSTSAQTGWLLVDDFNSYDPGLVRNVANPPWTALGAAPGTMFARIDQEDGNNYLAYGWHNGVRGAYRALGDHSLGATDTGTYFLQFNQSIPLSAPPPAGDTPALFGLTDVAAPSGDSPFGDYRVQMVIRGDPNNTGQLQLLGRSGGSEVSLVQNLNVGDWYSVWLVVNNLTNTYDVYWSADPLGSATLAMSGLNFRTATTNPLVTFLAMARGQGAAGGAHDFGTYLDNLYFSEGTNLVNPIPEPSTYALIFGALALAGVAGRRRFSRA